MEGTGAIIANAVVDAIKVMVVELPIILERIRKTGPTGNGK